MTSLIAGPCFNFLSKTIETCKSQKSKLDMEKIVMKSDSVRREKERLLKKRENSEEGSGKDDTRKPREIDLSSRNDGVALLDTTWLLKQYHKKPQVFNLMSVGKSWAFSCSRGVWTLQKCAWIWLQPQLTPTAGTVLLSHSFFEWFFSYFHVWPNFQITYSQQSFYLNLLC